MIALFDMDGTLFAGDSQLRFARWILRRHKWRRLYLIVVLPALLLRAFQILNTEQMKRFFLCYAWGMKRKTLIQECKAFVDSELIPVLYPVVKERLKKHLDAGDTTILCSASPDWWTQLMGLALGFSKTIGTPVELPARIPFYPIIEEPGNNKGANKLVRLSRIGVDMADIGYTDSKADIPMLSICKAAVLINPDKTLLATYPNAEVHTPPKGIKTFSFLLSCLFGV